MFFRLILNNTREKKSFPLLMTQLIYTEEEKIKLLNDKKKRKEVKINKKR